MKKGKTTNKSFVIYTIISIITSLAAISIIVVPAFSTRIVEKLNEFLGQISFNNIKEILLPFTMLIVFFLLEKVIRILENSITFCRKPRDPIRFICQECNRSGRSYRAYRFLKVKTYAKFRSFDKNYMISFYKSNGQAKKTEYSSQIPCHLVYILASLHGCSEKLLSSVKSICDDMKLDIIQSCEHAMVEYELTEVQRSIRFAGVIVVIFDKSDTELHYKLGIAHALNKPTILLIDANDMPRVPITGSSAVYYSDLCDLKIKLCKKLEEILKTTENREN